MATGILRLKPPGRLVLTAPLWSASKMAMPVLLHARCGTPAALACVPSRINPAHKATPIAMAATHCLLRRRPAKPSIAFCSRPRKPCRLVSKIYKAQLKTWLAPRRLLSPPSSRGNSLRKPLKVRTLNCRVPTKFCAQQFSIRIPIRQLGSRRATIKQRSARCRIAAVRCKTCGQHRKTSQRPVSKLVSPVRSCNLRLTRLFRLRRSCARPFKICSRLRNCGSQPTKPCSSRLAHGKAPYKIFSPPAELCKLGKARCRASLTRRLTSKAHRREIASQLPTKPAATPCQPAQPCQPLVRLNPPIQAISGRKRPVR